MCGRLALSTAVSYVALCVIYFFSICFETYLIFAIGRFSGGLNNCSQQRFVRIGLIDLGSYINNIYLLLLFLQGSCI